MSSFDPLYGSQQKDKEIKNIYWFAVFTNMLINVDHGILPAATIEMRKDLHIDDVMLGLLGSLVYLGLMSGSLGGSYLFQRVKTKHIVCASTAINIVALLAFPLVSNLVLLGISRFLVGFFQVFNIIYFPVWVDLYGEDKKTMWLAILQVSVPIGVFLGYAMTGFLITVATWKTAFYLQVLMMIPCLIKFLKTKSRYMATSKETGSRSGSINCEDEEYILSMSDQGSFMLNKQLNEYILGDEVEKEEINKLSIDEEEYERIAKKLTYWMNMRILWSKKVFIISMFSISALYFVVTGLQYWISDYMIVVLGQQKGIVFLSFGISSITGPTAGVLLGGKLIDHYGGYTSKHALDICFVLAICAGVSGILIPVMNNFWVVTVMLWLVLFFGGSIMPSMTGIMISSIPKKQRAFGSSFAQLISNACGYFPAPFLYGAVNSATGGKHSRGGMTMLMCWSFIGVIMLFFARRASARRHAKHVQHAQEGPVFVAMPDQEEDITTSTVQSTMEIKDDESPRPVIRRPKSATYVDNRNKDNDSRESSINEKEPRFSWRRLSTTFGMHREEEQKETTTTTDLDAKKPEISNELKVLKYRSANSQNKFLGDNVLNPKNLETIGHMFGRVNTTRQSIKFRGDLT